MVSSRTLMSVTRLLESYTRKMITLDAIFSMVLIAKYLSAEETISSQSFGNQSLLVTSRLQEDLCPILS